jgi:hypothetical protein
MNRLGHSTAQVSRRSAIKGIAGGAVGAALSSGTGQASAAPQTAPVKAVNPRAAGYPIWQLDRPKPALPNSYFWTWDHSANWVWDDPGMLNFGCNNRYFKRADTFVEDYRRLTDLAAGLGVKGVVIWGFLRDAHGGIESAKRVADYAASRGVAILPGFGTNEYGGAYYEGEHPYNMTTFLKRHPDARSIGENGKPRDRWCVCPTHPRFRDWIQQSFHWLFREFSIGGANVENGDFLLCHCPRCTQLRGDWPQDEPDFWHHQYLGYAPVLEAAKDLLKQRLIAWATYKGFVPGQAPEFIKGMDGWERHAYMECRRPVLLDKLPGEAICQWTLSYMVRVDRAGPLPLTKYLDNGAPEEALGNDKWPADLKPPAARNVGLVHQGSQWCRYAPRYDQVVSTIKEACLRAYRAGMEGVSIHGEVSSMHVPWALNYLAFSHFVHWPEDSLRQFGSKTLGQVLGSAEEGEAFVELLAHWQANSLTEAHTKDLQQRVRTLEWAVCGGAHLDRWRFWNWLSEMVRGRQDHQTVSIF